MNNDQEKWQWVDEDPIEKLIRGQRPPALGEDSALKTARYAEPLVVEEAADGFSTDATPDQTPSDEPSFDEVPVWDACSQNEPLRFDLASGICTVEVSPNDLAIDKSNPWVAAANSFRRQLETTADDPDALIGLGDCLLHLDCAEEALVTFERCLSFNAEPQRAMFGRAVALQKLDRYEQADRAYRELLQLAPDLVEPLANLIAMSVARRDTEALAEFSHRLLQLDPRSKAALKGLATHAIWTGDRAAAIDYCNRLVEVDSDCFEGRFNLGFAMQRMRGALQPMRSIA